MQFHMKHFWDVHDWLSELPEEDIEKFGTVLMTKGEYFVMECKDQKLLTIMALRWSHAVDNRQDR